MDFAGPFLGKMFLILVDAHSKWIDVRVMSKITSSDTIFQLKAIFATHGLPDMIVTDNGPSFTSGEFTNFLSHNGVQHVRTTPFHPASNGLAERAVQTFKSSMKTMQSGTVDEKVLRFLTKYRTTPQTTTGMTPAELLLGRKVKTKLDLLHPFVSSSVAKSQNVQKKCHDKHAVERDIDVDSHVFVRNYSHGPKWVPGIVTDQTGPVSFRVKTPNQGIVRRHKDQLRTTGCDFSEGSELQSSEPQTDNIFKGSDQSSKPHTDNIFKRSDQSSESQTDDITKRSAPDFESDTVAPATERFTPMVPLSEEGGGNDDVCDKEPDVRQEVIVRRSGRAKKAPDKLNL